MAIISSILLSLKTICKCDQYIFQFFVYCPNFFFLQSFFYNSLSTYHVLPVLFNQTYKISHRKIVKEKLLSSWHLLFRDKYPKPASLFYAGFSKPPQVIQLFSSLHLSFLSCSAVFCLYSLLLFVPDPSFLK